MGFAKFPSPDLSIAVILFLEIFFFLMALASRRAPASLMANPKKFRIVTATPVRPGTQANSRSLSVTRVFPSAKGLGRDQQVAAAKWSPACQDGHEASPRLLRQGFKKAKPQVRRARPDAVRSVAGSVSSPAIEQLRSDHDAGANARLSNPANVLRLRPFGLRTRSEATLVSSR